MTVLANFPTPKGPGADVAYNARGELVMLGGWPVTQRYGVGGHPGIDLGVPRGTPLCAVLAGVANQLNPDPTGGGLWTTLAVAGAGYFGYGHAESFTVANGATVAAGDELARSDSTGHSTGDHLHFAYKDRPGPWQDPTGLLIAAASARLYPGTTPPPVHQEDDMPALWIVNGDLYAVGCGPLPFPVATPDRFTGGPWKFHILDAHDAGIIAPGVTVLEMKDPNAVARFAQYPELFEN